MSETEFKRQEKYRNLLRGAKPGGKRDKFRPTEQDRQVVRALIAGGVSEDLVCKAVINPNTGKPIDKKTLLKYFREELESASLQANARVIASLYQNATVHNNVAAQIFWLKTRLRWRDVNTVETLGADGKPVDPPKPQGVLVVPAAMIEEEWEKLAQQQQADAVAKAGQKFRDG